MRSSIFGKVVAAAAAVFAACGGLAVAGALPAPAQNTMSHVGIGAPSSAPPHHGAAGDDSDGPGTTTTTTVGATTTSTPAGATPATVGNHGAEVSAVAHDHTLHGCEHGRAVAKVASRGKSKAHPCPEKPSTSGPGTAPSGDDAHTGTDDSQEPAGHGNGHVEDGTTTDDATTSPTADGNGSGHNDKGHREDQPGTPPNSGAATNAS